MKYIFAIISTFLVVPGFAQALLPPVQHRPFQTELQMQITQHQNKQNIIARNQNDPRLLHFLGDTYRITEIKEDFVDYRNPEMTTQQKLAHALLGISSHEMTHHSTLAKQQYYNFDEKNWIFVGSDVGKKQGLMTIQDWKEVAHGIYEPLGYKLLTNDNRNPNDIMVSYKMEGKNSSVGYVAIRIFKKQNHVFTVLISRTFSRDNVEDRRAVFQGLKQTPQDVFLISFGNKEDCYFGDDCY